jgi:hypothetical protein
MSGAARPASRGFLGRLERLTRLALRGALVVGLALAARPGDARAFTHVVRKGETLASIAKDLYGRADYEFVLVGANSLDAKGGTFISAGMRLEIPALGHERTALGDTWPALADRFLGSPDRANILAHANGAKPWTPPEPGTEIVIPYVLRHVGSEGETVFDVAQRYLGDKMLAWQLVLFNDLPGNDIRRGQAVLIPLVELPLTDRAKAEAEQALAQSQHESGGGARARQKAIEAKLPELHTLVRDGRWIEAVGLGEQLLGMGDATRPQRARIGKLLTVAYAALDARGAAAQACRLYLENVTVAHLEPATTSPKILEACDHARALLLAVAPTAAPAAPSAIPSASASASASR